MQVQLQQSIKSTSKQATKKSKEIIVAFGIESLILFAIAISLLIVLNYFSILPLSNRFPNIFGVLPVKNNLNNSQSQSEKTSSIQNPGIQPRINPDTPQYLFSCPIPKFCTDMKNIYDKETRKNRGQGYLFVEQGNIVQSITSGTITTVSESDGVVTIVQKSLDQAFDITYKFSGKLGDGINNGVEVENYAPLGAIEGGPSQLAPYATQNYYMYFEIFDTRLNELIPVKPVENANGLELL